MLIDFGGHLVGLRDSVKHYTDLAPSGSYMEAIGSLYDVLRWSETKEDAKIVLIADILALRSEDDKAIEGEEHREALFDRVYRATSGRLI